MHLSPHFPRGQTRDPVFQLWQEASLEEDLWLFVPRHFPVLGHGHPPSIVQVLSGLQVLWVWVDSASLPLLQCGLLWCSFWCLTSFSAGFPSVAGFGAGLWKWGMCDSVP